MDTTGNRTSAIAAALAVAVPLAWTPLTLLHPFGLDELIVGGQSARWLMVHVGQLVLTPLLALVMLRMVAGHHSITATVARVATILWVGFFTAFDALAGIATGVLARGGHNDAGRALFDHGVVGGDFTVLSVIAHPLWGAVAIATAMTLTGDGHRRARIALYLSAPFAITHVGPVATLAMAALAYAVWSTLRPGTDRAGVETVEPGRCAAVAEGRAW